jgi:hypothetical protein
VKKLLPALALMALAAPAAAIPPGSGVPPQFPQDARWEAPPIWVSYHGIERWIFNPVQCFSSPTLAICGDPPPITPSPNGTVAWKAPPDYPVLKVRRGEEMVFHVPWPIRRFAITPGTLLRIPGTALWKPPTLAPAHALSPVPDTNSSRGSAIAWRVTGRSGLAQIQAGRAAYGVQLVITG